jgi:hypothetical protein
MAFCTSYCHQPRASPALFWLNMPLHVVSASGLGTQPVYIRPSEAEMAKMVKLGRLTLPVSSGVSGLN